MAVVCLMPGGGASQMKAIVIGEGVRGAMYMPAYIEEEKGYFKKRDLDSKIVTFSRSNDINALVSGDIQFDQTSPDKVIHSALGGFPVKMVMATTRGNERVDVVAAAKGHNFRVEISLLKVALFLL